MKELFVIGSLMALSTLSSAFGGEFDLQVDQSTVQGREAQASALMDAARGAIPPAIASAIGETVLIRFKDLDKKGALTQDFCTQEREVGQILSEKRPYVIEINSVFLDESIEVDCYEGSTFQIAVGGILHELSHFYDSLGTNWTAAAIANANCTAANFAASSPECTYLTRIRGRISEQPRFLSLTGWEPYSLGKPVLRNRFGARSVNPHEFLSPGESFAVNMEYFLLDPSFLCRRPALYHWYADLLRHSPYPGKTCPSESQAFPLMSSENREIVVDPARVAAIDLLVAMPGKETLSNFGHSMLRLVVCAPEREEVSEKCRADKDSNIVVSPVGFGDGLHISTEGILSGKHKSYLVFLPYRAVEKTYTREQLQELKGYPLQLDELEKSRLINATLERYWTYLGNYNLFSNNCADEIRILLQAAVTRAMDLGTTGLLTPKRLANLALRESLASQETQYRIPSALEKIDREVRLNIGQGPPAEQILRWSVNDRVAWGKSVLLRNPENLEMVLRDLLGIERVAHDQLIRRLAEKTAPLWWEREKDHKPMAPRSIRGNSGYGIPLGSERPDRPDRQALGKDLLSLARESNLPEYLEVNESWAWQIEIVKMLPRR